MRTATLAIVATVAVGIVVVIGITVLVDTYFNRAWKDYERHD